MSFNNENLLTEAESQLVDYALKAVPESALEASQISIACSLLVIARTLKPQQSEDLSKILQALEKPPIGKSLHTRGQE